MASSEARTLNRVLTEKLARLIRKTEPYMPLTDADVIVSHIEINDHHGVGVLLRRLFGKEPNILSVRSKNFYQGEQEFGARHVCIPQQGSTRDAAFWNVAQRLGGITVKRILCIPYFPDDALNAIAIKSIFGGRLCTYLMDDQNLCADGIPDSLMTELLGSSSLRLAISSELCDGYERKYGRRFWFMPPLVPGRFIPAHVNHLRSGSRDGVIVGNIWGRRWIELLRETVRGSGITLRWFNNGKFPWLPCSKEDLAKDGVVAQETCDPDEAMIAIIRDVPYVVVPSGTLDETDDRRFIAQLSFPSRIPYIFATSHAPILVLGSPDTAAARFVRSAGVGLVAPYRRDAFLKAVEQITAPEINRKLRERAFELSERYRDDGAADWIWRSLEKGEAVDRRFQELIGESAATVPAV